MDAVAGRQLGGIAHLRQSVRDILTTPIGSRAMRRDYGSRLFELTDRPTDRGFVAACIAATAEALARWEPRYRVTDIQVRTANDGRVSIDLVGEYLPEGRALRIDGIGIA